MSKVTLQELGLGTDDLTLIGKLSESGLTAEELADTIVSKKGTIIDRLLYKAITNTKAVKVISIGDSTEDSNKYIDVLTTYFNMLNITCYQNAQSGQSGQDWKNNTDQTTLQQCIDACIGVDGEDTICLFSHGINDYKNGATEAQVKGWLLEGLNLLKVAKPKVNIVLVSPVFTGNDERNIILKRIYEEMSVELNLKLIDSSISTGTIHGAPFFYADPTHPNITGHERRIIYMLHELLPTDLHRHIILKEKEEVNPPSALELYDGLTDTGKLWNTGDGLSTDNVNWLRIRNRIAVEPNFVLNIEHYGTRFQALFYDQNDAYIGVVSTTAVIGQPYQQLTIPGNAWFMRLNITDSVSTYTNTLISIKYFIATSAEKVTMDKILKGLSISFPRPIEPMVDTSNIVLPDKSINIGKVDFITLGKNLFDKDHLTTGFCIQDSGAIVASASYAYTTNAVPVIAGQVYNTNIRFRFITYYDINNAVIGYLTHTFPLVGNFTPPVGAMTAKFSIYVADAISTLQLEKGSVNTAYESFGYFTVLPSGSKVRISELTPNQIASLSKINNLTSTALEIDDIVASMKEGLNTINFTHPNMVIPSSWNTTNGATISDNTVTIRRYGTALNDQNKLHTPAVTVLGTKYIALVNLENVVILNPAATILNIYNYSQSLKSINIADYILSGVKIIAIPFTSTVNGTNIQIIAEASATINTLPTNTNVLKFDSKFIGFIPWTQKDEDYWSYISSNWLTSGFKNNKVARASVADKALNIDFPKASFKEIKNIADRKNDIYNTNIVKYDSTTGVISSAVNINNGTFNCSATVDLTANPSVRGWFGLDIQPANYATEAKSYVLIMVGTGVFQNVATMVYTQPTGTKVFVQDPADGQTVNIKDMIPINFPAGLNTNARYGYLRINTRKTTVAPAEASYALSFSIFTLFEVVDGFSIDDYINAYNNKILIPIYSKTGTATETYVKNNLSIAASSIALGLNSNNFSPKYDVEMFLSGGQSLNVGGGASSLVDDFKNTIAFPGGSGLYGRLFTTAGDKTAFFGTDFNKLGVSNEAFPPVTASTITILRLLENENRTNISNFGSSFMPFAWGSSGTSITTQHKGSQAYTDMIEVVTKANEFVTKKGKTFSVRSMNWYHGEADSSQTKDWYYTRLAQMFTDINTDIKAITGQVEDIEFFTYQTAGWANRNMGVQEAQLQLASERANVHLAGAMYQFSYSDTFHPVDRAVIGLQTGVAMKRVLYDNLGWVDFKPISHQIKFIDNKYFIHLKFDVPVKPLRFDISGDVWHNPRGKQTNFGFEVLLANVEKQIAEPFVTRGDTVVLTTTENPVGMTIKYAVTGHDGGGNLCDSQNILIRNKNTDYVIDNFAVAFSNYIIT